MSKKQQSRTQSKHNQPSPLQPAEVFSGTRFGLLAGSFLLLTCAWLALAANPLLSAYFQRPVALFTADFFKGFLSWPRGPLQCVAGILTVLYYRPWMGIAGIVAVFALLIVTVRRIVSHYTASANSPMILIPVTILLGLHSDPRHFISYDLIVLVVGVSALLITAATKYGARVLSLVNFLVVPVVFYLAGIVSAIIVVAFSLADAIMDDHGLSRRIRLIGLPLWLGITYIIFYYFIFFASAADDFAWLQSIMRGYAVPYVTLTPLLFVIMAPFFKQGTLMPTLVKKTAEILGPTLGRYPHRLQTLFVSICLITVCWHFRYPDMSVLMQMENHNEQKNWEAVRSLAGRLDEDDREALLLYNRALFHQGHLLDTLFAARPQAWGVDGLVPTSLDEHLRCIPAFIEIWYDLGEVNQSLRWTFEEIGNYGYTGHGLEYLARNHIVINNLGPARKAAAMLEKVPFYTGRGHSLTQQLADSVALSQDEHVKQQRDKVPRYNYIIEADNPEIALYNVFKSDSSNRMALEYLVGALLLKADVGTVAEVAGAFAATGYVALPRHVQEALCIYSVMQNVDKSKIAGIQIDPAIIAGFNQYNQVCANAQKRAANPEKALAATFGSTYWYYVQYTHKQYLRFKESRNSGNDQMYKRS
jgi:hypothetical protein